MGLRDDRPEWLYEALPYLYGASGLATILVLANGMGTFSGLMLISAGALVKFMRMANRSRSDEAPGWAGERSVPGLNRGFLELVWRKEYACGNRAIDAQHRQLFASGNGLLDAVLTDQPKAEVERLLGRLVVDVKRHFETEEGVLEAINGRTAQAHKETHRRLRARANTLLAQYREGEAGAGEVISFLTYELIASHIASEDKRWFGHVRR